MKADAARPEDRNDLLTLRDALGLRNAEEAMRIVERYVPANRLRIQTQPTVESLFELRAPAAGLRDPCAGAPTRLH